MSTFTVQVTPGYVLSEGEEITNDILNAMATPTVQVAGAISSASIADGSVTNPKLAADAVQTINLKDGNVTTAKLADLGVTTAKLAAGAVTSSQIGVGGVAATNLAAGAVLEAALGCATPATVSRKLRVAPANAAPLSKMTCTADEIVLRGAALSFRATAVNVTADITINGANGLDTGAEAANTWYFLHVVYNPTGPTVASLLSLSATAPTMPAGYTMATLVGAVHNGAGSDFDHVITYGNGGTKFVSGQQACTLSTPVTLAHNLGIIPDLVEWYLVNINPEAGYAAGDRVRCASACDNSGFAPPAFAQGANATNVFVTPTGAAVDIGHKTTGVFTVLAYTGSTLTNWKLVAVAEVLA